MRKTGEKPQAELPNYRVNWAKTVAAGVTYFHPIGTQDRLLRNWSPRVGEKNHARAQLHSLGVLVMMFGSTVQKLICAGTVGMALVAAGCKSTTTTHTGANATSIPLVTPIVQAATPRGLHGARGASLELLKIRLNELVGVQTARATGDLSASAFKDRFFSGMGPTDILGHLLPMLDSAIGDINTRTASSASPCVTQTPVEYTIHPFGQDVTMYGQCYDTKSPQFTGDPGLTQFGVNDGKAYLYDASGTAWTAAIITPLSAPDASTQQYAVEAWLTVGAENATSTCGSVTGFGAAWDTCSYGVIHLKANEMTGTVELAIAGIGFGYCGAQLISDGTNIFAAGSEDMGSVCTDLATTCLSAADATTAATCTETEEMFALAPLGRTAGTRSDAAAHAPSTGGTVMPTWGASNYPSTTPTPAVLPAGTPSVVLDGTTTDALHGSFGPTTATTGLGALTTPMTTM